MATSLLLNGDLGASKEGIKLMQGLVQSLEMMNPLIGIVWANHLTVTLVSEGGTNPMTAKEVAKMRHLQEIINLSPTTESSHKTTTEGLLWGRIQDKSMLDLSSKMRVNLNSKLFKKRSLASCSLNLQETLIMPISRPQWIRPKRISNEREFSWLMKAWSRVNKRSRLQDWNLIFRFQALNLGHNKKAYSAKARRKLKLHAIQSKGTRHSR